MINDIIFKIKQDKKLYLYLLYHSTWYYILTYNPEKIKDMIQDMKIEYKETSIDKIKDLSKKIEMVSSLLDVLS